MRIRRKEIDTMFDRTYKKKYEKAIKIIEDDINYYKEMAMWEADNNYEDRVKSYVCRICALEDILSKIKNEKS